MKKIIPLLAFLFINSANASFITSGTIFEVDEGVTVDYWGFSVNTAGVVTFDILSWEAGPEILFTSGPLEQPASDLNGDGEIAFLDTHVHLFKDDGALTVDDVIASNDDAGIGPNTSLSESFSDGSDFQYDSFLSLTLDVGDYIFAIGTFNLGIEEAIFGLNGSSSNPLTCSGNYGESCISVVEKDHGDYQITWSDNVQITSDPNSAQTVPETNPLLLLGFGVVVLRLVRKNR